MKILNEELKRKIVEKAVDEFFEHGFKKASLRKIVKEAGTTIGNFYNYYKSKEDLFYSITDPAYNALKIAVNHPKNEFDLMFISDYSYDYDKLKQFSREMFLKYFLEFNKAIVILYDGSRGTKYEGVRAEFIHLYSSHILKHIKWAGFEDKIKLSSLTLNALAEAFISGAMCILKKDVFDDEKIEAMTEFMFRLGIGFSDIARKN